MRIRSRAFPNLIREYNSQARDNFVTDAMLLRSSFTQAWYGLHIHTVRVLLQ